jgi:cell division protein FtsI (penicillin-binding protein 3)
MTARPSAPVRSPARRLVVLLAALSLGFAGILARLLLLQVRDASAYQALARNQRVRTITLPATRGTIFDRNGNALALSVPATGVYADPSLVTDPVAETAAVYSDLHLDYIDVYAKLAGKGTFTYLARGVDQAVAASLEAKHLAGIGFLTESRRAYPSGDLASQVLGVVGVDGSGLGGLELWYQKALSGTPGRAVVEADPSGTLIPQGTYASEQPVAGDGLVLTIDSQIEYEAQNALAAAVHANQAKGGTVIVIDPSTGEILAMTTYPSFDPNHLADASYDDQRNRAITDAYEPGSVNKVVGVSGALEEGILTLDQRLTIPQTLTLYDKVFKDAHTHPTEKMTLADIIAYSSNIGAIKVAQALGAESFYSYLQSFGLTTKTGVDFPGESSGILPILHAWSGLSIGTIPFGQGIAVTPLQMAEVYATIANGGVWVQPHLVRATIGPDGKEHPVEVPGTHRVVSAQTAQSVAQMLAYAVDVGTGQEAQIQSFWVAGKTGTAQKVSANGTGYTSKFVASFIGFAPAARPSLVVAAILDEPVTEYGGVAAAPLFQRIASFALSRLHVAPEPPLPIPPHAIKPE